MSITMLRKKKGLTSVQVAEKLHISQGQYSHIENGTRSIREEMAQRMAELYEVDKEVILQKSKEVIKLKGTIKHWLSHVRYRGESLVDIIVNELRYDKTVNLEESEQLIYVIAGKASEKIREEIIWNFKDNPEFVNYFIKRLKK